MFDIPITLIIYNRPDTTFQVLDAIKKINPSKLYVIADGPNRKKNTDNRDCIKTRKIIDEIDLGSTEIIKYYSDNNLGCGRRVFTGLNQVFEKEDYTIILEDDIIPSTAFFNFCKKMLLVYENDFRIMQVSGSNFNEELVRDDEEYFFSKYSHIWGWATWKRAWEMLDYDMKKWTFIKQKKILDDIFRSKKEVKYFTKMFDAYYNNESMPWASRWFFTKLINSGLAVTPVKNLVTNIGVKGTHSDSESFSHNRKRDENYRINRINDYVVCNEWYDKYHFRVHILHNHLSFKKRMLLKLRSLKNHKKVIKKLIKLFYR